MTSDLLPGLRNRSIPIRILWAPDGFRGRRDHCPTRPLPQANFDSSLCPKLIHVCGKYLNRFPVYRIEVFSRSHYRHNVLGPAHAEAFFTGQILVQYFDPILAHSNKATRIGCNSSKTNSSPLFLQRGD